MQKEMLRLQLIVLALLPVYIFGNQFYVSPTGQPFATGSINDPWDLQTAFNHPVIVQPGDTIWLRDGYYYGKPDSTEVAGFISYLTGTKDKPILVRQYPGERAIIDGVNRKHPVSNPPANDSYILGILGDFTWYWGFEVTNSNTHSRSDSSAGFRWRVNSIVSVATGVRLINLIVHDTGSGLGPFSGCVECELYGNLIFYNGWSHLGVRGHGEGVYGQNMDPVKFIRDNIIFKQFDSGLILYGSSNATINNFHVEGNVLFANGTINDDPNGWGFLFGKSNMVTGPGNNFTIQNNYLYNRFDYLRSNNIDLGYQSGLKDVVLRNNYSVGRWSMRNNLPIEGLTAYQNTFVGELYPVTAAQVSVDSNFIFSSGNPPKVNSVFVRPNLYEPGRAHIISYNWLGEDMIEVDLGNANLEENASFEILDVQNIFGDVVYEGKFSKAAPVIMLPANSNKVTEVIGDNVPRPAKHTDPVFNVFLLRPKSLPVNTDQTIQIEVNCRYHHFERVLSIQMPQSSDWKIQLTDFLGKPVESNTFYGQQIEWQLPELIPGIYFVNIMNETYRANHSILIAR
jgi:hypothetical protein